MVIRVMVVEDDEIVRGLTAEIVSLLDVEVIQCDSADAALATFDSTSIAMVITDVRMPGSMDGLEMARVMSTRYPGLPVIIMSGNLSRGDGGLPPRAVFLHKPYRIDELHAAIRGRLPVQ